MLNYKRGSFVKCLNYFRRILIPRCTLVINSSGNYDRVVIFFNV